MLCFSRIWTLSFKTGKASLGAFLHVDLRALATIKSQLRGTLGAPGASYRSEAVKRG